MDIREICSISLQHMLHSTSSIHAYGDPLVIVTKPGTTPSAIHVPAPVPIHYQTEVKKGLDRDVALGVLEKVPVNTPVEWLHRMVIAPKKDGSLR